MRPTTLKTPATAPVFLKNELDEVEVSLLVAAVGLAVTMA
jgi:hypothetical protein